MYVPLASRAGAHIETQAPWVELWPPSVLMAHDLRSNQGRHISSFLCSAFPSLGPVALHDLR